MSKFAKKTITYQGIDDTIHGHALRCGVSSKTVYGRISRLGGFEQITPDDYPVVFGSAAMKPKKGRGRSQWSVYRGWLPVNPDMRAMPFPMI